MRENSITLVARAVEQDCISQHLHLLGGVFVSQGVREAALLWLAYLLTVVEPHLIMVLQLLHLHYQILFPNRASVMETSGFAAIRFTVWANSGPQTHTFNNKPLHIKTDSDEEVVF